MSKTLKTGVETRDLVALTLRFSPAQSTSVRELRRLCHASSERLYAIAEEKAGTEIGEAPAVLELKIVQSVSEVVREFLMRNLGESADKNAILKKAEELLARQVRAD